MQSLQNENQEKPALMSVADVGAVLKISPRTVYRLSDAGRMPRPVRLSRLTRWRRVELENWLRDGCPNLRTKGAAK